MNEEIEKGIDVVEQIQAGKRSYWKYQRFVKDRNIFSLKRSVVIYATE